MKVIDSDTGFLAFDKMFKDMQLSGCLLVVWQVVYGTRSVTETILNSYYMDSKKLHFGIPDGHKLNVKMPLYVYSENGRFIFKASISELLPKVLTLSHPNQIILLEHEDIDNLHEKIGIDLRDIWKVKRLQFAENEVSGPDSYVFKAEPKNVQEFDFLFKSMSERTTRDQDFLSTQFAKVPLDEEDKVFADLRESPRARPRGQKMVKVSTFETNEIYELKLYDLSTGGISFITDTQSVFVKGNKIKVMGFDEFDLDDPLIAEVMSERPVDENFLEFKVGCKFEDGQS